ncbi:hypothetical protein VR41_01590 [Streptomyces sp. NRRL B-1568]|nr:hypothetical protein VR41_01590 [Streptomyces sp. NRRL B-1568]
MVTFAQAQERAERWVNGDVPAYLQREVRVREFDLGFVAWSEDREDGPTGDGGRVRLVIARDSGETTLWPGLPVGEVIRRYEEEYGAVDDSVSEAAEAPPRRVDLEATSFLLSPPQWLQDAADAMGIPDRRSGSDEGAAGAAPADAPAAPVAAPAPVDPAPPVAAAPAPAATPEPAAPAASAAPVAEPVAGPSLVKAEAVSEPPAAAPWADVDTNVAADGPAEPEPEAVPWAGADANVAADAADDRSVGLPATVLAPALSGMDEEDKPRPGIRADAKTELMPQGSALPRTTVAPALDVMAAPSGPPAGGYVRTQMMPQTNDAGVPGAPGQPPVPGAPAVPGVPGQPPVPGAPVAPGAPGAPVAPGVPGQPGAQVPGAPAQPPVPGAPAAPGVPGQPPVPGAPVAPGVPGQPGAAQPSVPGAAPEAPGQPGTPAGGAHAAATMLAGPGTVGPPAPGSAAPGMGPGYPQPPAVPTVGPGYMAVLRYRAQDGSEQQIIRRSAPGTPHPEWQILHELRAMNVPPQQVLELHTELESCELPGGYCARMVRETWPQVRISHTAAYGRDLASRQQGMRHLVEHQGELHQVADGPARPAPNRAPLPQPGQVPPAQPVGPDVIGRELAECFGPQGVFRFDQRAVSRQGVPDVVAQTLVWAGLPVDFGPFFWGQAQPGRPVPTLAELAAERGVQPAPDAGSYLVVGSDYGRQLCVQYGTAHIVAVPLEAGPDGRPAVPQFVNTSLPQFVRSLALLGKMWRWRYGLTPEQAGRWTVDFQDQLASLDPVALSSPENWWAVLLEQMWDGLF